MGRGQDSGFIKVHRKALKSTWWQVKAEHWKVGLACLLLANWRETKWFDGRQEVTLRRGEFVTSLANLAKVSGPGISVKTVRGALVSLSRIQFLTKYASRASRYTRIFIINYELYQSDDRDMGKPGASEGQVKGKPGATGEEGKKLRREEGTNTCAKSGDSAPVSDPSSEAFELADFMRRELLSAKPDHRVGKRRWDGGDSQRRRWALELDRMHRLDGRAWRRSAELVRWIFRGQTSDARFVVESATSLREKWDRIDAEQRRPNGRGYSAAELAAMAEREASGARQDSQSDGSPEGVLSEAADHGRHGRSVFDGFGGYRPPDD